MCFDISLIIDIILTVVTAAMAIATYYMAMSTKESVEEMRLSRKEANSAEVVVYFKVEASRIYLIIENIGKTVAKDVKISSVPKLEKSNNGISFDSLNEISFLPPNYQIKTYFDESKSYKNNFGEFPNFTFSISFKNIYEEFIEREYVTNLNYLEDVIFLTSESDTVERSLYKIRKNLEKKK